MWIDVLPSQVKTQIANLSLRDNFTGTADAADRVESDIVEEPIHDNIRKAKKIRTSCIVDKLNIDKRTFEDASTSAKQGC